MTGATEGYAINEVDGGGIDVRTISPTRISAIINWLVVNKSVAVTQGWSDAMVENAWQQLRGPNNHCVRVTIALSNGGPND